MDHGANVYLKNEEGRIALPFVAFKQSKYTTDIMKILVERGSHVDATGNKGNPPLHYAVRQDTEWTASIVQCLLHHGANVHLKTHVTCPRGP